MEQALPAAMIVGTLVDPMATLLNANGDVVSAMVTRVLKVKNGFQQSQLNKNILYFFSPLLKGYFSCFFIYYLTSFIENLLVH
jgi:hypothetical protein